MSRKKPEGTPTFIISSFTEFKPCGRAFSQWLCLASLDKNCKILQVVLRRWMGNQPHDETARGFTKNYCTVPRLMFHPRVLLQYQHQIVSWSYGICRNMSKLCAHLRGIMNLDWSTHLSEYVALNHNDVLFCCGRQTCKSIQAKKPALDRLQTWKAMWSQYVPIMGLTNMKTSICSFGCDARANTNVIRTAVHFQGGGCHTHFKMLLIQLH